MRYIILIVIITAAVVAGLAMLWLANGQQISFSSPAPAPQPVAAAPGSQVATVDVLVARVDIPVGSSITDAMVDRQPWPSNLVLDGFITDSKKISGMVARSDFRAREPLIMGKLARSDDASFLAASLTPGMRAVTLAVDTVSAVGGYLFPGDRVDVVLAHSLPQEAPGLLAGRGGEGGAGSARPTTAEVVLANVKVLAVNTRRPPQPQSESHGISSLVDSDPPGNITLEISPADGNKLRLAEKSGTLTLALRSINDRNDTDVGQAVTLDEITQLNAQPAPKRAAAAAAPTAPRPRPDDELIIVRGTDPQRVNAATGVPMGGGGNVNP